MYGGKTATKENMATEKSSRDRACEGQKKAGSISKQGGVRAQEGAIPAKGEKRKEARKTSEINLTFQTVEGQKEREGKGENTLKRKKWPQI